MIKILNPSKEMKKFIIGITASQNKSQNLINNAYIKAFNTELTTPIIIPNLFDSESEIITEKEHDSMEEHIMQIVKTCDALVLSGGVDLSPTLQDKKVTKAEGFNQNRDIFEKTLTKWFVEEGKPVLGICRGFQLLGNSLRLNYFQQDLSLTNEEHDANTIGITSRREPIHAVHVFGKFKKWLLDNRYNIGTKEKMRTNSWHHQGFTLLPNGGRIKDTDLEDFVEEKKAFKEYINTKAGKVVSKAISETKLNEFKEIEIIMSTNSVIEGFQHKEFPILGFQYHPEEYNNSPAINYFINLIVENQKELKKVTSPSE